MKALIIAGDRQIVAEILKIMFKTEMSYVNQSPSTVSSKKKKKPRLLGEGALLLDELDINMPLVQCDNTLEFLILSFCRVFSINAKTSAGLLMQQGKFLLQILSKGLKGRIEPVIAWYDLLLENTEKIAELIIKEKTSGSLQLVLGSIKGGLNSKDFIVVQKCCESLVSLHELLKDKDLNLWDWFSQDVYTIAFKAYDLYKEDVTTFILKLLVAYGKDNLRDVFGQKLIANYPEPIQCFNVISSFWGYINEDSNAYQNIQTQGLVDYWVEFGLREAENEPGNIIPTKVSALGFLCDVWCKFAKYIEQHEDSANSILTVIKRACREKSKILKVICYGRLFLLLSEFSKNKNTYAPIIYKTLTFALVENYSNDRVREFLLNNFLFVMEEISGLPISVLIEPYIKQAQVIQKPRYNTSDFDFYVATARHPKLTVKDAVIVIDSLGKIYYSDYIYANSAEIPLVLIFGRFIESKPIQEYIIKFIQLGLKMIYSKLSPKPKIPVKDSLTKEEQEEEKILSYYKKLVLALTEKIIHLGNRELNHNLKEILVIGCIEVKKITGGVIKGLKMVLDLLGDSSSMIEKYETASNPVSSSGHSNTGSYTSYSIVSVNDFSKRKLSIGSRNDRALSDIERVKQIRKQKEHREKSQSELWRIKEERQKITLRHQLEQRKILLGVESKLEASQPIVVKEAVTIIEMPFYLIEEETKLDQELIWNIIKKYSKVFRTLFLHYASSGYKKDNFSIKPTFESMLDKKTSISEGEFVKLLRDQKISNNLLTTEEFRKVTAWMLQKYKIKSIEYDRFTYLLYYVSEFIFTRHPVNYSHFPPGIGLIALMDQFKKSSSRIVNPNFYDEPDYGVGDKDIIKMLNQKLKHSPNLAIPEGYKKVTEKEVIISYAIPEEIKIPISYKTSIEILDSIFFSALEVHILSPIVSLVSVINVKGVLTKPQIELEDKAKEPGIPINRASYKLQPLPAYMSFTPGIKLEVAKLSGTYPNDLLLECARLVDDLIYTVESKSFEVISRNPKTAGTISNKISQKKIMDEAIANADKEKNEARRRMRKQLIEERLKELRNLKSDKLKEDEENKIKEEEYKELKKMKLLETRAKEKTEIEKRIKEFKLNKEQEQSKNEEIDRENQKKIEEKKKRDREEFLRDAKRKLMDKMSQKKEEKKKTLLAQDPKHKSLEDQKKDHRKLLMSQFQRNKEVVDQEKNQKQQVYIAMIDPGVVNIFKAYSPGLEVVFQYFCKMAPVANTDTTLMSLAGFNKFVTQFPIVPALVSSDESLRNYKGIMKTKTGELGINSSEFREIFVNIAISSLKILEDDTGKKLKTYGELMQAFIDWIGLPQDAKKATEFLKKLMSMPKDMNPRDKKRNKNAIIKNLSEH